jgi:hypothetical protein
MTDCQCDGISLIPFSKTAEFAVVHPTQPDHANTEEIALAAEEKATAAEGTEIHTDIANAGLPETTTGPDLERGGVMASCE